MKPTSRLLAAVAVPLCVLLGLGVAPDATAETPPTTVGDERDLRPIVKKRKIARGVTLAKIVERQVPRRTFVLRIDPSKPVTLDVALARNAMPARRTVLAISKAHGALAAVNGDFSEPRVGRPVHPFAQDGDLVQTSTHSGPLFALSRNERRANLGRPELRVSVTDRDTGQSWRLPTWNQGAPAPGEIAGFSPTGGRLELPPSYSCSARLLATGPRSFDAAGTGVVRDYVVDATGCSERPMARKGGVVLSTAPATDEATQLLAMTPGTRMRLRWSLGWKKTYDVVGGMPILVHRGREVARGCSSSFCRRNPRTGIGFTKHGGILLVVVDGRRARWSAGATLREFATIMRKLGSVEALNLDGGGSTTMTVRDRVVNRPSDGRQRRITNAVLVLKGRDPGER